MTRSSSLKPFLMFREDVQYSGKWGLIDISLSIPTCCFFVLRSCLLLFDPGQQCGVKHVRRLNLYPKNVLSRLWSLFGSLIWVLNVNGLNFSSLSLQLSANQLRTFTRSVSLLRLLRKRYMLPTKCCVHVICDMGSRPASDYRFDVVRIKILPTNNLTPYPLKLALSTFKKGL